MSRKIKYSLEFKLAIIGQVLSREKPLGSISRENGIERRMVYQWVQFYKRFGDAGLIPQSTVYSLENKLEVIRYFISNKVSLREACLQFNIRCNSVLSNWLKIYESAGSEGLSERTRKKHRPMNPKIPKKAPSLQTDHEQVLEENNRLRAEVAFLKKLRALIQKEESKKNKKR